MCGEEEDLPTLLGVLYRPVGPGVEGTKTKESSSLRPSTVLGRSPFDGTVTKSGGTGVGVRGLG